VNLLLFFRLVEMGVRRQLVYRTAMWAGLATNLFFGLIRAMVLTALYQGQDSVNGMGLAQAITYAAVAQATLAFLNIFGSWDVMRAVYDGAIAGDLMRPINFYWHWLGANFV
jgi:ABC-2 type transport system permease protein